MASGKESVVKVTNSEEKKKSPGCGDRQTGEGLR